MSVMLSSIFPSTLTRAVLIALGVVWKSTEEHFRVISHGIGIEYLDNPKMKFFNDPRFSFPSAGILPGIPISPIIL